MILSNEPLFRAGVWGGFGIGAMFGFLFALALLGPLYFDRIKLWFKRELKNL